MHTVELHELMPRNQLIPKTIRRPEILDIEQLEDLSAVNYDGYNHDSVKPVEDWTSDDIANWLIRVSKEIPVDYTKLHGEKFVQMSGDTLLKMTEKEFLDITPEFGTDLYISIKRQLMNHSANSYASNDAHVVDSGRSSMPLYNYENGNGSDSENSPPPSGNYGGHNPNLTKPLVDWTSEDIADWLIRVAKEINVDITEIPGEQFVHKPINALMSMTEREFLDITPKFGRDLYNNIKRIMNPVSDHEYYLSEPAFTERYNSPAPLQKRKRGRPSNPNKKGKKKQDNSFGRLWEFLRDLLKNPDTCPRIIKWENHDEGLFRFVQSDEVAKIWGRRKANSNMTYEKLSRAMRYYYGLKNVNSHYLKSNRKRLVYQFGPKATGWRVDDPNFEKRNRELLLSNSIEALLEHLTFKSTQPIVACG